MTVAELVTKLVELIVNPAILIIFAVGFFFFMYGMVEFLWGMRQGEVQSTGRDHMIYGILGMLIMVSVYGILRVIADTFGINPSDTSALQSSGGSNTGTSGF